jgi:hypothetical protein
MNTSPPKGGLTSKYEFVEKAILGIFNTNFI